MRGSRNYRSIWAFVGENCVPGARIFGDIGEPFCGNLCEPGEASTRSPVLDRFRIPAPSSSGLSPAESSEPARTCRRGRYGVAKTGALRLGKSDVCSSLSIA